MKLIWKLLRQHISVPQFVGFFFANLFGMFIVLLGVQFYRDVLPVFTAEDSFMKADYLVVSKKVGTGTTISGRSSSFTATEMEDLRGQSFVKDVGAFVGNEFRVTAKMGINGTSVLNSEIFLQSVPDTFVDTGGADWSFSETSHEVPIILPRTYINMYNFGFAQSRSLPKISEGIMGLIDFNLFIHGNGKQADYKGRVVGFSSKLNEILVPMSFMKWANEYYAPENTPESTRLMVAVDNPADEHISSYLDRKGYELDTDKLNQEKTTYFLRLVISLVLVIGLVISVLSFYILMLSIYLLVEKNSAKLQNLLLIGYKPGSVALPYQFLTIGLNVLVLGIALVALFFVRNYYMDMIYVLFPQIEESTMLPAIAVGIALFILVTLVNQFVIRRKIQKAASN
jgi:hypothetical protein